MKDSSQRAASLYQQFLQGELVQKYLPHTLRIVGYSTLCVGAVLFAVPAARMRFLQMMLQHRGWLFKDSGASGMPKTSSDFETRKKIYLVECHMYYSPFSFFFQALTRFMGGSSPKLFSLQEALPCLPLDTLEDLQSRYLCSVRPLLNDADCLRATQAAACLQTPLAKKLQCRIQAYKSHVDNWVCFLLTFFSVK